MFTMSATDVRKDWSTVMDTVIRNKPVFIKRTRDQLFLSDLSIITDMLSAYKFTAQKFIEEDGSVTLSLNEIDLVESGACEREAIIALSSGILEYAEDYYNDYEYWSSAPNRKSHIPYILKALIVGDADKLGEEIECLRGKI